MLGRSDSRQIPFRLFISQRGTEHLNPRCSKTRPLIPLHPRWRMARRMQKAASRGPAQRHNEVSFKIERPERSGPTAPRCAARCAALRPPRWCTPPMRCEACTNASASGDVGYLAGFRQEGRHFWSMVDQSVPKGGSSSAPFSQPYTPFGRSRRLDGKGAS